MYVNVKEVLNVEPEELYDTNKVLELKSSKERPVVCCIQAKCTSNMKCLVNNHQVKTDGMIKKETIDGVQDSDLSHLLGKNR